MQKNSKSKLQEDMQIMSRSSRIGKLIGIRKKNMKELETVIRSLTMKLKVAELSKCNEEYYTEIIEEMKLKLHKISNELSIAQRKNTHI